MHGENKMQQCNISAAKHSCQDHLGLLFATGRGHLAVRMPVL